MSDESTTIESVRIEGNLTMYEVTDIHRQLLSAFETADSVRIEWGEIGKADSAGVQILVSSIQTAKGSHKAFDPGTLPQVVTNACAAIGVQLDSYRN